MPRNKTEIACQRLQTKYGISLKTYEEMLAAQFGGCAICGRPPSTKRLHVDHDHKFRYAKLTTTKKGVTWFSYWPELPCAYGSAKTKPAAIKQARQALKALSVRGLCCSRCNRGLAWFFDNPVLFRSAAAYLDKFKNRHKI